MVCLQVANGPAPVVHVVLVQERRIAELESQLEESQQQLEGAQSNRTVTQEALDQASSGPWCLSGAWGGISGLSAPDCDATREYQAAIVHSGGLLSFATQSVHCSEAPQYRLVACTDPAGVKCVSCGALCSPAY